MRRDEAGEPESWLFISMLEMYIMEGDLGLGGCCDEAAA
jgi:hypothetical protein